MKFSADQINQIDGWASNYLDSHPKRTHARYAIERVAVQLGALLRKIQARLVDIDINNCLVATEEAVANSRGTLVLGEILHEPDTQLPTGESNPGRVKMDREGRLKAAQEKRDFL